MKFLFLLLCFFCPVTALAEHDAPSWKKIHTISANKSTSSVKSIYDKDMLSPKSAVFSKDGQLLYVNALEASKTLIF